MIIVYNKDIIRDRKNSMENKNTGAIWEAETKSGAKKMSISLRVDILKEALAKVQGENLNLTSLVNTYKEEGDNRPEWNILPPRELDEQGSAKTPSTAPVSNDPNDPPF